MEGFDKRSSFGKYIKRPDAPDKLWCGKIQGLCTGKTCQVCHLFPARSVDDGSLISSPTLTDHRSIGLIREREE